MFIVDTSKQQELSTGLFEDERVIYTRQVGLEALDGVWLLSKVTVDDEGHSGQRKTLCTWMFIADWIVWLAQAEGSTIHLMWPLTADAELRRCVCVRRRRHGQDGELSLSFEMEDGVKIVIADGFFESAVEHDELIWKMGKRRARGNG